MRYNSLEQQLNFSSTHLWKFKQHTMGELESEDPSANPK